MRARQLFRLTASARGFVFMGICVAVVFELRETDDSARQGLLGLVGLAVIWSLAQLAAWKPRWGAPYSPVVVAVLVGSVLGLTLEGPGSLAAALTVPPFAAALHSGLSGLVRAVAAQTVAVVVLGRLTSTLDADAAVDIIMWTVAAIGLGLIADFVRSTLGRVPDELAPYLDAQNLLRDLIALSSGLSSGLDVNTLGGEILSAVRDEVPTSALALYVPSGDSLVPVITTVQPDQSLGTTEHQMASEAWLRSEVVVSERFFAFRIGERAMVGGLLSDHIDPEGMDLPGTIGGLRASLQSRAVQLDTALLFAKFRDSATADERHRLAREMHDGVAQEIASLGYLVDALAARPADDKQAAQLELLRTRITGIVAEVRRSVLTLRTSIGENESLGAAISSVARHLNERSGVPIQVTLDEHTGRLRQEVEAELFRIAQEAMNNAIKHAQATVIDVHCRVHSPSATVTVSDDGRGLQEARDDSHGLQIMHERARLVGARLSIEENSRGGVTVRVEIADASRTSSATAGSPERVGT